MPSRAAIGFMTVALLANIFPTSSGADAPATRPSPPDIRILGMGKNAKDARAAILKLQGRTFVVVEGTKVPDAAAPAYEIVRVSESGVTALDLATDKVKVIQFP
jgi:hypothetical protein